MVYRPNVEEDLCFVLLPLKAPFIGYFEQIIQPACAEAGLSAIKADDIYGTRAVIQDIWEHIWKAKAVVAIVTGRNPNVNYELGICHTLGIPTVLLTNNSDDVPFDYRHRRYIKYESSEAGWEIRLREQLTQTLRKAIDPTTPSDESLPWPYNTERLVRSGNLEEIVDERVARSRVLAGIETARSFIAGAIGPEGKGIAQRRPFSDPVIVRSGTRMLDSLSTSNVLENQGIDAMKRLGRSASDRVGDYTKTAILLGASITRLADIELQAGKNLNQLTAGMNEAAQVATAHLRTQVIPISDDSLYPIAASAARNDEIAMLVSQAIEKVGKDGVVEIEETSGEGHELQIKQGMHFFGGYFNPGFSNAPDKECILENCRILLFEPRISNMRDLLPVLEHVARLNEPILIVSSDVEGEALATLLLNARKGTLQSVAVKAPGMGDRRRAMMEDIATYTGATAITQETGRVLSQITEDDLGYAVRIVATPSTTTIHGGRGDGELISSRISELRADLSRTNSPFDAEKLRERLARLSSGIATIRIGGYTDSDRAEARYSAESALHSCTSALEHGCVVGAGVALLRARRLVGEMQYSNDSQGAGIRLIYEALGEPARAILATSNVVDVEGEVSRLEELDDPLVVFDVKTGRQSDCRVANVLDAAESLRIALKLALGHAKSVIHASAWTTTNEPGTGVKPLFTEDDQTHSAF